MSIDQKALETLIVKDEIRELALLYSRDVDRKDVAHPLHKGRHRQSRSILSGFGEGILRLPRKALSPP